MELVHGSGVDQSGEHACTFAEEVADGREAQDHVHVLLCFVYGLVCEMFVLLEWPSLPLSLVLQPSYHRQPVFFRHQVLNVSVVHEVIDTDQEKLRENLCVREDKGLWASRLVDGTRLEAEKILLETGQLVGLTHENLLTFDIQKEI